MTSRPPTLLVVPVNDRNGRKNDTVRNIEATSQFVVNLVPCAQAALMTATATPLPPEESEFTRFGVEPAPSVRVRPPRVAAAPIAFECALHQIVTVGEGPLAANIIIGRIVLVHAAEEVLGADGLPDPVKLDLVARLGGEAYTGLGPLFTVPRPDR